MNKLLHMHSVLAATTLLAATTTKTHAFIASGTAGSYRYTYDHAFRTAPLEAFAHDSSDLWQQLERVSEDHAATSSRKVVFNIKELERQHSDLIERLAEETPMTFDVPRTTSEALTTILDTPSMQFSFAALAVTLCVRMALGPWGIVDVVALMGTKAFWEMQEWCVHAFLFHGNGNQKSIWPFENHDKHHNLPYYHVAMETLPMVVGWYTLVASLALAAVATMGVPPALSMTCLASYTGCGIAYMIIHFLTHTKLPLKGWLQDARAHHIQHHMEPTTNLNMVTDSVDRIMQTDHRHHNQ